MRFYPGATGLKTGFTAGAGYCLSASASRDGMELVAVVMGCETSQDRFNACKALLDYGFANYALVTPTLDGVQQVPVKLGKENAVTAGIGQNSPLLMDKSQKQSVTTDIVLEEMVTAPVSKGQRLGTLTVKVGQQILAQIPLVAQSGVPRLTFGEIFKDVLKNMFMK